MGSLHCAGTGRTEVCALPVCSICGKLFPGNGGNPSIPSGQAQRKQTCLMNAFLQPVRSSENFRGFQAPQPLPMAQVCTFLERWSCPGGLLLPGCDTLCWVPASSLPGLLEKSKKMCPVFWKTYLSALLSPNVLEPRRFHGKED